MSRKELSRVPVIEQVLGGRLTQREAGQRLGLCARQIKRLVRAYRSQGPSGLVSGHRGKRPNNTISDVVREQILGLVRERFVDFSPTLAHEKLCESHGYQFSVETLRKWMVSDGIWEAGSRKTARIHQRRPRRPRFGELIQIDGSPHDWFEGRAPRCTLIVFIDDATSCLMALRFAPSETTQVYLETLNGYLSCHGVPLALYSDRHSIFRVNHPEQEGELTQFTRALKDLDITPIHARTPQAKGRVERANQTLQDRLVKELRLQGINTLEDANRFLPTFMEDYNRRFAVTAQQPDDAHRRLAHGDQELARIFSVQHTRVLTKNLTLQYHNIEYQLVSRGKGYRLRGATITVCQGLDGAITLWHDQEILAYRTLAKGEAPIPIVDEKSLNDVVDQAGKQQKTKSDRKPAPSHPWRRTPITANPVSSA